jgi:hypothetical protein
LGLQGEREFVGVLFRKQVVGLLWRKSEDVVWGEDVFRGE